MRVRNVRYGIAHKAVRMLIISDKHSPMLVRKRRSAVLSCTLATSHNAQAHLSQIQKACKFQEYHSTFFNSFPSTYVTTLASNSLIYQLFHSLCVKIWKYRRREIPIRMLARIITLPSEKVSRSQISKVISVRMYIEWSVKLTKRTDYPGRFHFRWKTMSDLESENSKTIQKICMMRFTIISTYCYTQDPPPPIRHNSISNLSKGSMSKWTFVKQCT